MDKLRVFLGIGPAADLWANQLNTWVAAFRRLLKESGENPIRWIPAENLHLTLRFFGSVTGEEVAEITKRLPHIVASRRRFILETTGLALFPNSKHARVAAIELSDPSGELLEIEASIRKETRALGRPPDDRTFRAHVTFGRIKDSRAIADLWPQSQQPRLPPWPVNDLKLFLSETSPAGSVYTPLATFVLPSVSPQV